MKGTTKKEKLESVAETFGHKLGNWTSVNKNRNVIAETSSCVHCGTCIQIYVVDGKEKIISIEDIFNDCKQPKTIRIDLGKGRALVMTRQADQLRIVSSIGIRDEKITPEGYDTEGEDAIDDALKFHAAIDGMESLLLALWCAGFDVMSKKFKDAINTTLDAISNQFC